MNYHEYSPPYDEDQFIPERDGFIIEGPGRELYQYFDNTKVPDIAPEIIELREKERILKADMKAYAAKIHAAKKERTFKNITD